MHVDYAGIYEFIGKHSEVLILLGLAFVMTMPSVLPWPFNRVDVLNWAYAWMHDALRAFANSRQPAAVATTETHSVSAGKEETTSSSVTVAAAPVVSKDENA